MIMAKMTLAANTPKNSNHEKSCSTFGKSQQVLLAELVKMVFTLRTRTVKVSKQ